MKPPRLAVMVTAFPLLFATPVTTPVTGSTVAVEGSEEVQMAPLRSCVVLSLKDPVTDREY